MRTAKAQALVDRVSEGYTDILAVYPLPEQRPSAPRQPRAIRTAVAWWDVQSRPPQSVQQCGYLCGRDCSHCGDRIANPQGALTLPRALSNEEEQRAAYVAELASKPHLQRTTRRAASVDVVESLPRLSDAVWTAVREVLPGSAADPRTRKILDVILFVLVSGVGWTARIPVDLSTVGSRMRLYRTLRRWVQDGTWERIRDVLEDLWTHAEYVNWQRAERIGTERPGGRNRRCRA